MFPTTRRSFPPVQLTLVLLLCALAGAGTSPASAQGTTIYRCTDAGGTLTVQNRPCPSGSTQREQQMQGVSTFPSAPATAVPATGAAPADGWKVMSPTQDAVSGDPSVTTATGPEPRILDSANLPRTPAPVARAPDPDRPPLPPLFRCGTYDGDSYLAEDQEQPPRCLALRTVGLDGNPAGGAGRACEVVRDQCSRVPDGAACDAWQRYAREAESRFRFAHPDNVERRRTEYERLAKIVSASCS